MFKSKLFPMLIFVIGVLGLSSASAITHGPYDPTRDAFQDFHAAQLEAQKNQKLILIQIGGNWCSWCHRLERFFQNTSEVKQLRDQVFVSIKVNVSPENENTDFLNMMPEFEGYPFLVITDAEGEILNSRTSGVMEEGSDYSKDKFIEYFRYWQQVDNRD